MSDGQTGVGMSGWMRVKIMDFETTLLQYSMCMTVIGFMLPPLLSIGGNTSFIVVILQKR